MKPLFKTKRMLTATLLALVMMVAVGATLALMASTSNSVTNTFAAAQVDTDIEENTGDPNVKEVTVKNNGKSPVYVRARIMVSGVNPSKVEIKSTLQEAQDAAKENPNNLYLVMPEVPNSWARESENGNYTDDFYYYKSALPSGQSTESLMTHVVIGDGLRDSLLVKDEETGKIDFVDTFNITIYHESVLAINQPEPITVDIVKDSFDAAQPNP